MTTPDDNVVSKAEFARLNGWTKPYVTKLKDEGRLVLTDDGQVQVAESLARIQETTKAPERASEPAKTSAIALLEEEGRRLDNRRKKREIAESEGLLIEVAKVTAAAAEAGTQLRRRIEAWPHLLAPQLATMAGNEARIRGFLTQHVATELEAISAQFAKLSQR